MRDMLQKIDAELARGRFGDTSCIQNKMKEWHFRNVAGPVAINASLKDFHPLSDYFSYIGENNNLGILDDPGRKKWQFDVDDEHDGQLMSAIRGSNLIRFDTRPMNAIEFNRVSTACDRLGKILPNCGKDVASNIKRILVIPGDKVAGSSQNDFYGVLFIGETVINDDYALVEGVFHEALHSKKFAYDRAENFAGIDEDSSRKVKIPWRKNDADNYLWSMERVIDAFHVYVHLTVLQLMWVMCDLNPQRNRLKAQTSAFRAAYLSGVLRANLHSISLQATKEFILWMDSLRIPSYGLNDTARQLVMACR